MTEPEARAEVGGAPTLAARAVAIDGPAGAGKSTVARAVARALGWSYVDTGAMYRAVALAILERGYDPADAEHVETLVGAVDIDAADDRVFLDGRDVTERIRRDDVTAAVSAVSAHPGVRRAMVERQRTLARRGEVVMEGRDIGSAVIPAARVKVFLDASLDERARRRARQQGLAPSPETLRDLAASLAGRDEADSSRAASPLVRAREAVVIDSTDEDVDGVVDAIVDLVRKAENAG
jgi:cytidylate kinase